MKTLYIECSMGAAGDMLMGALLQLHENPDDFLERLNNIGIPDVKITKSIKQKCAVSGVHIDVEVSGEHEDENMHENHHHHHHHHSGINDIKKIIDALNISQKVKDDIKEVYNLIAEAEGAVHGCDIEHIHFHEVGSMDAVADIAGICMLLDEIAPKRIVVSPVNVGSGFVKCAHGTLPVPAPATAYILKDVPIYSGNIKSELCTPTGAAVLKYFADEFSPMPPMRVSKIGCGAGTKNFDTANIVRIMLGESENKNDEVFELKCNVDDMTGEEIGYATRKIKSAGAADVFTVPIGMKKNRPAVMIVCICGKENKENVIRGIFKNTSTIGIRESVCTRFILERKNQVLKTKYGDVCIKKSEGYGTVRIKAEYDDIEKAAEKYNVSVRQMRRLVDMEIEKDENR